MKINWFKILIYASLLFLIYYLVNNQLLTIPKIKNIKALLASLVLLFCAFILLGFRWHAILKVIGNKVSPADALISCGLSIYAKYIPGKLLMIIGKTSFIRNKYQYRNESLIVASLNDQLIAIWAGLLLGSISLINIKTKFLFILVFCLWIFLSFSIFHSGFYNIIQKLIKKVIKKEISIEILPLKSLIKVLPLHFSYWFLIGLGFYLFFYGLTGKPPEFLSIFAFPLSVVMGIISVISPGGIGVREAILGFYFTDSIGNQIAVTLSSTSRLWFLTGETFLFLLGFILNIFEKKESIKNFSKFGIPKKK